MFPSMVSMFRLLFFALNIVASTAFAFMSMAVTIFPLLAKCIETIPEPQPISKTVPLKSGRLREISHESSAGSYTPSKFIMFILPTLASKKQLYNLLFKDI